MAPVPQSADHGVVLIPPEARSACASLSAPRPGLMLRRSSTPRPGLAALGKDWLRLDFVARAPAWSAPLVGGQEGWLGPELSEPWGVVAAVTSLHASGRVRERAVLALGEVRGPVSAAALAVRCLDHVPEVRALALPLLVQRTQQHEAHAVLGVLLAATGRTTGGLALQIYSQRLTADPDVSLLRSLLESSDRATRRWAFGTTISLGLQTAKTLLLAVGRDRDQWIRSRATEAVVALGERELLRQLLTTGSVDARLVALQLLEDDELSVEELDDRLMDSSRRVREVAHWRCRRRSLDPAGVYRRLLDDPLPRRTAACLNGLAATGVAADADPVVAHLSHASPSVRAAAVSALMVLRPVPDCLEHLPSLLLDGSPQVSNAAVRALVDVGAGPTEAASAWRSHQVWSRRAAWRLSRSAGGWETVIADLRAATDDDVRLAGLGRQAVLSWLDRSAARTWQHPTAAQKARLQELLDNDALPQPVRRQVAFHAGIAG